MAEPAYTRLDADARRAQLLERATEMFALHGYEELSMARLAREAGISKGLLYHYFPSKRDLFVATLSQAAAELASRTAPDPDRPPAEQLAASLDAYLAWIEEHREAYAKLLESLGVPEVRDLVEQVRDATAARILEGIDAGRHPARARVAVHGWLWGMDGACLAWLAEGGPTREELREVLLGALGGALLAAGARLGG